jgi:host factor-I protein
MAAERAQNLQDTFLNHVRKQKIPLTIFLVNGVKLQGVVTWFDNFCVLLRRDGHSQLVYKHAISTIMPGHPVQLFEPEDTDKACSWREGRQFVDDRQRKRTIGISIDAGTRSRGSDTRAS